MLQVLEAFALVVRFGMVFGEVVCSIVVCFLPVDAGVDLVDAVTDPVEAHIDSFGLALLDSVLGDA